MGYFRNPHFGERRSSVIEANVLYRSRCQSASAANEASRGTGNVLGTTTVPVETVKFTRSTHVSGLVIGYVQTRSFSRFAKNAGQTDAAVKREAGWSARVSVARSSNCQAGEQKK